MLLLLFLVACDDVDNAAFDSAVRDHRAAEVTVRGTVVDTPPDAPAGADGPHQRIDVSIDGTDVEIDHNLDLAQRVPAHKADSIVVRGQFEPDPGHPVIHDTHHATGRHQGGYIQLNGTTYQ